MASSLQKIKSKTQRFLKYALIASLPFLGKDKPSEPADGNQNSTPPKEQTAISPATKDIAFQVDTIDKPDFAALYCTGTRIIRNYALQNSRNSFSLALLVHEQKHKDNFAKGIRSQDISPLQYAKMCMHDEISANICELLTLRFEYLAADNKNDIIQKYKTSKHAAYFRAIEKQLIFPEKNDAASREQEWQFIAQQTRKMWMKHFEPHYRPGISRMISRYINRMNKNVPASQQNKNYDKVLNIAYNIGGINFGKYLQDDLKIDSKEIIIMNKISSLRISADKLDYSQRINSKLEELKQREIRLTPEITAHVYLAEGLKLYLEKLPRQTVIQNPDIIALCYQRVYAQLQTLLQKQNIFQETVPFKLSDTPVPADLLSDIYAFQNHDLTQMIDKFKTRLTPNSLRLPPAETSAANDLMLSRKQDMLLAFNFTQSPPNTPGRQTPKTPPATRRLSPKISIKAPDFSQPILSSATPAQLKEIFETIAKFNPDSLQQNPQTTQNENAQKKKTSQDSPLLNTPLKQQRQSTR